MSHDPKSRDTPLESGTGSGEPAAGAGSGTPTAAAGSGTPAAAAGSGTPAAAAGSGTPIAGAESRTPLSKPSQNVSPLAITFCVMAGVMLIVGIYILLNLHSNQTVANQGMTLAAAEDASKITAQTAWLQIVFAHQLVRAKFVAGIILGAFLVTLSCALISQGLHSATQESDLSPASVPPSLVELREKRKWIYLIPGVILALCSTLILSLALRAGTG